MEKFAYHGLQFTMTTWPHNAPLPQLQTSIQTIAGISKTLYLFGGAALQITIIKQCPTVTAEETSNLNQFQPSAATRRKRNTELLSNSLTR